MEMIQIGIIEDDKVIRSSLSSFLSANTTFTIAFEYASMEQFIEEFKGQVKPKVDVVLMDIGLPGLSGIQGIFHVKKYLPTAGIIMLTTYEESEKIFEALCAGAQSYLTKRTPLAKIAETITTVYRGGSYMSPAIARKVVDYFSPKASIVEKLTDRQEQIVSGIKDGLSYKMIAAKLGVSIDTIRYHIKNIYSILEVNCKTELLKKLS